jgi:hypothetical protein
MLSIPSGLQTQQTQSPAVSLGLQDVDAQKYYPMPQKGYGDKPSSSYSPPPQMGYGGSSGGGSSYESNSYDSNRYDSGSYSQTGYGNSYGYGDSYDKKKNYAELEDDRKLHVCKDTGIVVDDRINCPKICPPFTEQEGHYVTDISICNFEPDKDKPGKDHIVKCDANTDLPGVLVKNQASCNIFDICTADDPLGQALGLDPGETVKVADETLCQLAVPEVPDLEVCTEGAFTGFVVNDLAACDNPLGQLEQCTEGPLAGLVTTNDAVCDVFTTCPATSSLGEALGGQEVVADPRLCNLEIPTDGEQGTCNCDPTNGVGEDPICQYLPETTDDFAVANDAICQLTVQPEDVGIECPAESSIYDFVTADPATDPLLVLDERLCTLDVETTPPFVPETCTRESGDPIFEFLPATITTLEVVDENICQIDITQIFPDLTTCPADSNLAQAQGPESELPIVTDEELCNAAVPATQCPFDSILSGVWYVPDDDDATDQCNPEIGGGVTERTLDCYKCVDLAIFAGYSGQNAANAVQRVNDYPPGTENLGIGGFCENTDRTIRGEFRTDIANNGQNANDQAAITAFNTCLDRAGIIATSGPDGFSASDSALQTSSSNMQPNSLESQTLSQNAEIKENHSSLPLFNFKPQ